MNTHNNPRAVVISGIRQMIAGLTKHYAGQTLQLAGKRMTVATVIAQLEGFIAQLQKTSAAHSAWLTETATSQRMEKELSPMMLALPTLLRATFGGGNKFLLDFGLALTKRPRVRTSKEKEATAQKSLATRKERHTVGKRQRAKIRGTR